MRAAVAHVEAIRSLQMGAPAIVKQRFVIGEDGSFDLEAATMMVRAVG